MGSRDDTQVKDEVTHKYKGSPDDTQVKDEGTHRSTMARLTGR
jgi:hypothetical protein